MEFRLTIEGVMKDQLLEQFVDNIDFLLTPYNINEITLENRPNDLFSNQPPLNLRFIIEEIIRREILTYEHLLVLLHENTIKLTCDEDIEYTPYQPTFLELISKRCKNLEELHYHYYRGTVHEHERFNGILRDSISRLENLREINFYDAKIEDETLRVIALNCGALQYLNLHKTGVSGDGIRFLCGEASVVKPSLRTLIADYTYESPLSAVMCLVTFVGLKHFESDSTFWGIFRLLESSGLTGRTAEVVKFETTVLKNSFKTHRFHTPPTNLGNNFVRMFPNVNHLKLTSIRKSCIKFVKQLIPPMNITDLELSADVDNQGRNFYDFEYLSSMFDACGDKLISLKLEKFIYVNVVSLSEKCKNLRRLFLINNTYDCDSTINSNLFKELIELQIILIKKHANQSSSQHLHLNETDLHSLLSSSRLTKILICCQSWFSDTLMGDLFEDEHLLNLNEIFIYHCDRITDLTLWELAHNTRPIKKVEIGFSTLITDDIVEMLNSLIRDNKLDVSVSYVTKIPYSLRWSVIDLPISDRDMFDHDNSDLYIKQIFQ